MLNRTGCTPIFGRLRLRLMFRPVQVITRSTPVTLQPLRKAIAKTSRSDRVVTTLGNLRAVTDGNGAHFKSIEPELQVTNGQWNMPPSTPVASRQ
ncbi:hypothetical protein [Pseudomonas sp. B28(2017)]|uniref:hypothetical protein n=1 Tax=Pseudomonas sp. B28(2017) TaxID=1981730 RepID=UPI00117A7421|nr:hypothetical protein [Pseudomonas sp. B28(2017)]